MQLAQCLKFCMSSKTSLSPMKNINYIYQHINKYSWISRISGSLYNFIYLVLYIFLNSAKSSPDLSSL